MKKLESVKKRYQNLCKEENLEKYVTVLANDPENNPKVQEGIKHFGEDTVRVLDYSPENIHFLSSSILDFPIGTLVVYDFLKFFEQPFLISATKKALIEYDSLDFSISFPNAGYSSVAELEGKVIHEEDGVVTFGMLETLAYMILFQEKTGLNFGELDNLYEQYMI